MEKNKDTIHEQLFNSALEGNISEAQRLIKLGADVNAISPGGVHTVVASIIGRNHSMVRLLLNNGADPNILTSSGESVLWFASINACP